jgi:hypothetical protein
MVWSSFLDIAILEDSTEIYFTFSEWYYIFLRFLNVTIIFWNLIEKKNLKPGHTVLGCFVAHGFGLSARPTG